MKRILLFSLTCLGGWVMFVGCSSSGGGGGGGIPCDEAGACPTGYYCQAGACLAVAQGGSGGGAQGGSGGVPSGGGGPSGGSGGISGSGGSGGVPPVGGGGGPSGGGGGPSGGGGSGGTDCQTCLESNCSFELSNCNANPDCVTLVNCINGCSDQVCVDNCASSYPGGVEYVLAVQDCGQAYCSVECAGGG